ncbi:hypothetical protein BS17DRAFT_815490 [Gyrodon lividus]|nr:hypothetical protein BS17DRAFT_815490 [Gyrodon lividus]
MAPNPLPQENLGKFKDPEILPIVNWIPGVLGVLPVNAIKGGFEADGERLYIARAPYEGGIYPGKASAKFMQICYDGKAITIRKHFELLIGAHSAICWVPVCGKFSMDKLGGAKPVRGGNEADKDILYIAQAALEGKGVQCGKVQIDDYARIPFGDKEQVAEYYNVLVYA